MRRRALPSSGDGPCLHLATGLAFIWRRALPSSGDGPCLHLATGLAFIWRRALPSSGDGPCLHLATGLAFIWRRARIHLATGADSSAANQGEAAPARAVWRAGSRPDQATEGETADSRIEAKARTWPGRGNVPKLRRRARTDPKRSWRIRR